MKTSFFICLLFLGLVGFRNQIDRTISGTVYSAEDKQPLPGVSVSIAGTDITTSTDKNGRYAITVNENHSQLTFIMIGYDTQQVKLGKKTNMDVWMKTSAVQLDEVITVGHDVSKKISPFAATAALAGRAGGVMVTRSRLYYQSNTESYKSFTENKFITPLNEPLSTLAADIDGASYSNVRRFLQNGQLPPTDAVRIEEMINYFHYHLPSPTNGDPVAIHTELATAPWNPKHQLLRIGLKAKSVPTDKLPPSNLVFLIDVSGSMNSYNRLPLAKTSLKVLVDQLRENDHVAIVTYAGQASTALESTSGKQKGKIKDAINALEAGGATAGGAGIQLAYHIAKQHFIKGGNNRIVLVSDGDFNVGPSSDEDMERLISKERQSGISLSVFGFGMGNLKDSKMETLANKGHGNYAYIDNIAEARKAVVTEFGGTLFTVAKDVKLQIEFNPAKVRAYRLLGYENRLLEKEDFNNDHKLGGDMGVGHTVTAFYEIVPIGVKESYIGNVDPLKYQQSPTKQLVNNSTEIATVKFRFKDPDSEKNGMKQSTVDDKPLLLANASDDFRFATAVAELGMLLRHSEYRQQSSYDELIKRARQAKGTDDEGYRAEFIRLAENAKMLQ